MVVFHRLGGASAGLVVFHRLGGDICWLGCRQYRLWWVGTLNWDAPTMQAASPKPLLHKTWLFCLVIREMRKSGVDLPGFGYRFHRKTQAPTPNSRVLRRSGKRTRPAEPTHFAGGNHSVTQGEITRGVTKQPNHKSSCGRGFSPSRRSRDGAGGRAEPNHKPTVSARIPGWPV